MQLRQDGGVEHARLRRAVVGVALRGFDAAAGARRARGAIDRRGRAIRRELRSSTVRDDAAVYDARRSARLLVHDRYDCHGKDHGRRSGALIEDGDAILISGSGGGHAVPEALLAAVERRFLAEGKPRGLTSVSVVGVGDRAALGASHLAHEGLLKRAITSALVDSPGLVRARRRGQDRGLHAAAGRAVAADARHGGGAARAAHQDRASTRSSIRASRARGKARARRPISSRSSTSPARSGCSSSRCRSTSRSCAARPPTRTAT